MLSCYHASISPAGIPKLCPFHLSDANTRCAWHLHGPLTGLKANLLTAPDFFYMTQCLPMGNCTLPCLVPRQGTVFGSSLVSVPGEIWMKPQTHLTLCGLKYYINPLSVASLLAAVLMFMCFVTFANHFIRITYLNKTANNFSIYTIHDV